METTVPDLAYIAANLMGILSGLLSVASVLGTVYGVWTRQVGIVIEKCKDLLVISKEARNVFLAFLAVLLFTVAPTVKVNDMSAAGAIAGLTRTYCQFMLVTLVGTFVCSAVGIFRNPLAQAIKEHIGDMRRNSLIFAILGMIMTYVTSLA